MLVVPENLRRRPGDPIDAWYWRRSVHVSFVGSVRNSTGVRLTGALSDPVMCVKPKYSRSPKTEVIKTIAIQAPLAAKTRWPSLRHEPPLVLPSFCFIAEVHSSTENPAGPLSQNLVSYKASLISLLLFSRAYSFGRGAPWSADRPVFVCTTTEQQQQLAAAKLIKQRELLGIPRVPS
jgi:hypothetical protein